MRFIICVFFSLAIHLVQSQTITVISKADQQPVPGVTIYNSIKSKNVVTDFDGRADLEIFEDKELIHFSHVSHLTRSLKKNKLPQNGILELTIDENQLSEVVISVSKWEQNEEEVTQKIVSLSAEEIALATPQTSADLLQSSGQVYVQKSQLGGGSPVIRGFSTNRLLITVDGVRMNTAIFRGGNVQNVISIDPFAVDRTEVILGPGSVVYGSDAIGGVMNFYTPKPKFALEGKSRFSGNAIARYATASNEMTGHIDFNIGFEKWAFLSSISYTDFDDLKMGSHGPEEYLRNDYVVTENSVDRIVQNEDPETQRFTGYDQINFLQKIHFTPNERWDFNADFIYTTTSDYPRYDRLLRKNDNGELRSAEWFYGPQTWLMSNLNTVNKAEMWAYDKMKIVAAYQHFEESRNDRDFQSDILAKTKEKVDAYSFNLDFEKNLNEKTSLYYGGEYILNQVHSDGSEINIASNEIIDAQSRYPNGATWQSLAAYASINHRFTDELNFQGGLRYNRIILYSEFDDTFFDFPFTEANLDTEAFTGTAGFNWLPNPYLQWKLNFSTAFRAPNIDDVGKIFEAEPNTIVVPNPNLVPEYAYSGELGLTLKPVDNITIDLAAYYTHLDNALVRRDFLFNGSSTLETGEGEDIEVLEVQAIQNAAQAKTYGFEAGLLYDITNTFSIRSTYTFMGGEEELDDGSNAPARHVVPQFGETHFVYTKDRWMVDTFAAYSGAFSFDELAPSEQSKEYIYAIDENGNPFSPSWYTLNVRSRYRFTEALEGTLTFENLTDQRYRTYSSGIAAPGRNLIVSLKYSL